ncbi:dihydropyridine-sensitive L-type skeletal muscle calcium channel subunit alpha-1-like [Halichondria panicea]|uniref:dihydropyridine-sensitive L-type skeletal muscle calcium channel subunit alpha-1-like n=1 Tax=Halichondria panicea TaxID=6063 RepID=UPI00312B40F1
MAAFRRRRQSLSEAVGSGVRPASPFIDQSFTSLETRQSSSLRRLRVNTLEEVNISDHEIQALRSRVLHHRGSVQGTFTTESRLLHRVRRFINKIGSSREHYSLFIFHKNGWFRKNVKKIAKSGVFKLFMALVVLLHFVTQCFYIPTINGDDTLINTVIYYVTVVVLVLYIMEAVLNIIAYSLVHSPKAYLRKYAHVLDIFVIIVGILYIATSNINPLVGEIFASFMAFKLIKLFALSESVQFILKALAKSVAPLFYLGVLTFIVITFLALIGIQLFNGRLHKGCFASHLTPAGINRTVLVSEFPCTQNQSIDGSHSCPYGSTCAEWPEGPRRGIISFNNMIFAYLTVFQVIGSRSSI